MTDDDTLRIEEFFTRNHQPLRRLTNRHATRHAHASGHPVIASAELSHGLT